MFQSSVRINVGPNRALPKISRRFHQFQSSVRINVGPNHHDDGLAVVSPLVSILRED